MQLLFVLVFTPCIRHYKGHSTLLSSLPIQSLVFKDLVEKIVEAVSVPPSPSSTMFLFVNLLTVRVGLIGQNSPLNELW